MNAKNLLLKFGTRNFRILSVISLVIVIIIIFVFTQIVLEKTKEEILIKTKDTLETVLKTTVEGLGVWIEAKKKVLNHIGKDEKLVSITKELLNISSNTDMIFKSQALKEARRFFIKRKEVFGDVGFFIITKDGLSIASSRDINIGTKNLIAEQHSDLFEKVFSGKAVFIPPIFSDVKIGNSKITMFVVAPIKTSDGEVIAAVSQRLVPERDFSRVTQLGKIGESGETYAFDHSGRLITEIRFNDYLLKNGLLKKGESAILNLEIRNPKGNLTLMAQSAIDGNSGSNITGYLDYRGVKVYGSWIWCKKLNIGITTKMDVAEVLAEYDKTKNIIFIILCFTLLLLIGLSIFVFLLGEHTHKILSRNHDKLEERVRERTKEIRAILSSAPNALITADKHGFIQSFNPAAENVFGYTQGEVIGKNISIFVPKDHRKSHNDFIANYLRDGKSKIIRTGLEACGIRKDGSQFDAQITIGHTDLSKDKHLFVTFVRDISERKQEERELIKAKEVAEAATQVKADFLANMSHEIRTPMNAIIGFSDLVLKMTISKKVKDYVLNVNSSAKNLLSIINEILDYSKIEAGRIELEEICFNLSNLVNDILKTNSLYAEQKDLYVRFNYSDSLPKCFKGDPNKLRQIIWNLVGNAIKFTEKGGITVSLKEDNGFVHFSISDTGIGIKKENTKRIFDSFTQADNSTVREFGGTGLGTTISKRIVELMGGKIWVESEIGIGSIFHFKIKLPYFECKKECSLYENIEQDSIRSSRLFNILLAEDNDLNTQLIQINLSEQLGHSLTCVKDGLQAFNAIKESKGKFDLVLMDYQMPVLDGVSATKKIREWEKNNGNRIPIIALTASVTAQDQDKFTDAGMDSFVKKPINFGELMITMEKVVPIGNGKQNESIPVLKDVKTEITFESIKEIADVTNGIKYWLSEEKYAKALIRFARNHSNDVYLIEKYLNDSKKDEIIKLTHILKGLTLGLTDITNFSARLENAVKLDNENEVLKLKPMLINSLKLAIEAIKKLEIPKKEFSSEDINELDLVELGKLITQLLALFIKGESDEDIVNGIQSHLVGSSREEELIVMIDAIDDFDYDLASKIIEKMANDIGIRMEE